MLSIFSDNKFILEEGNFLNNTSKNIKQWLARSILRCEGATLDRSCQELLSSGHQSAVALLKDTTLIV